MLSPFSSPGDLSIPDDSVNCSKLQKIVVNDGQLQKRRIIVRLILTDPASLLQYGKSSAWCMQQNPVSDSTPETLKTHLHPQGYRDIQNGMSRKDSPGIVAPGNTDSDKSI